MAEQGVSVKRAPKGGLNHHCGIVKTWVDFATEIHAFPGVRLKYARPDWEIRSGSEGIHWPMIPDLLLILDISKEDREASDVPMAVEVDLGTERMPVLRRKVLAYAQARASGHSVLGAARAGLGIVFSETTAQRRRVLERFLDEVWTGWWVSWEINDDPGPVLQDVMKRLGTPLTSSPYCKGRETAASNDGSTFRGVRG